MKKISHFLAAALSLSASAAAPVPVVAVPVVAAETSETPARGLAPPITDAVPANDNARGRKRKGKGPRGAGDLFGSMRGCQTPMAGFRAPCPQHLAVPGARFPQKTGRIVKYVGNPWMPERLQHVVRYMPTVCTNKYAGRV